MSTFPNNNNDDYSVEEISYDDLMSILATRTVATSDSQLESFDDENCLNDQALVKQNELARRISENANQQLPDWLLNN